MSNSASNSSILPPPPVAPVPIPHYSEWKYYTEGRHHLLLSYHGQSSSFYHRMLLRVEKLLPSLDYSNNPSSTMRWDPSQYFSIVNQFISSKYLLTTHIVTLPSDFILNLHPLIQSSRPTHRQNDLLNLSQTTASVIPNLTLIHKPSPLSRNLISHSNYLTIELKIKSGLISISPFLPSKHLKRSLTKFQFMQHVKYSNQFSKSSSSSFSTSSSTSTNFQISPYNPNNLCSQNYQLIQLALIDLEENPQNNFIISFNGQQIYGLSHTDKETLAPSLKSFFHLNEEEIYSSKEILYDVISSILSTETALVQLQLLQSVDFLDTEGMILVFNRFSELTLSSNNSCGLEPLDSIELQKTCLEKIAHSNEPLPLEICLFVSQHRRQLNSSLLDNQVVDSADILRPKYLTHFEEFSSQLSQVANYYSSHVLVRLYLLSLQIGTILYSSTESNDHDQCEHLRSEFLSSLNLEECILLLRLWLLSLAACDASAILTLGTVSVSPSSCSSSSFSSSCVDESFITTSHSQSEQCSGSYCWTRDEKMSSVSPGRLLSYHLILVDLGPKPVDKILEKMKNNFKQNSEAEKGWTLLANQRQNCEHRE